MQFHGLSWKQSTNHITEWDQDREHLRKEMTTKNTFHSEQVWTVSALYCLFLVLLLSLCRGVIGCTFSIHKETFPLSKRDEQQLCLAKRAPSHTNLKSGLISSFVTSKLEKQTPILIQKLMRMSSISNFIFLIFFGSFY